jgi:glycine cleavage system protein P-like pyridoxal-binding family
LLTDTGLPKIISETINLIKSHESLYRESVDRFIPQLDIIKEEFEKYPNIDKEKIENARYEIQSILSDFEVSYIRPIDSDPGTTPFDCIRGLLPHIDQYLDS